MPIRYVLSVLALGAIGLSGCAEAPDLSGLPERQVAKTVQLIHRDQTIVLEVDARTGAPAAAERERLRAILAAQPDPERLRVTLRGPQSRAALERLATAFTALGVTRDHITLEPDRAPAQARDRVAIDIADDTVLVPGCPDWSRPDALGNENAVGSNLGCATATNLSLMLADPRDLVKGRGASVTDGGSAADAVAAWRADKAKDLPSDKGAAPLISIEGAR
jgi:pilus assembly protein CpaD